MNNQEIKNKKYEILMEIIKPKMFIYQRSTIVAYSATILLDNSEF